MTETNPAARLLEFLTQLRQVGQGSSTVGDALSSVLGASGTDSPSFELARANFCALILDIHRDLLALDGAISVDRHMHHLGRWTRVLDLGLGAKFTPDEIATQDELDFLSDLSDILNAKSPEISPSPAALDDLRQQVEALIESVTSADDLDADLRWLLLKYLRQIDDAIRNVRIRGQKGLEDVLGRIVADATQDVSRWQRVKNSGVWTALRAILNLLSSAAKATGDAESLTSGLENILQIEGVQSDQKGSDR